MAQLSRQRARGQKDLIITPGNYGEGFLADKLNLDLGNLVRCGDFINETIDMAGEFGTNSLLLAARLGKMLQLGNGIAGRYEWQEDDGIAMLSDCVLRAGGDAAISQRILYCDRLDDVVEVQPVWDAWQDTGGGGTSYAAPETAVERGIVQGEWGLRWKRGKGMTARVSVFAPSRPTMHRRFWISMRLIY